MFEDARAAVSQVVLGIAFAMGAMRCGTAAEG